VNPNPIASQRTLRGEEAYVYGLKARARDHHCLGYGTFSVDLERPEQVRRRYSREKAPITMLPLYVKATAIALERNPEANAILFKKPFGFRIVRFERVDVNLPITRVISGRRISFVGTIRDAASKSLAEIQREIALYQKGPWEESFAIRRILRFARMPFWLARLVHWRMTWSPGFYIRNVGSCAITYLEGGEYERFYPIAPTSLAIGIGAAVREPVVRSGEIVTRRILKCVLMVDNFVISGPTGADLIRSFKGLLESAEFAAAELGPARPSLAAGSGRSP
jgi:pyruvate/2-oxoglutarate dehydrogenase complex dihydrolipoamide acyltransferase (E2) component